MPRKRRQREAGQRDKGGGSGTAIRYRSRSVHPLEFRVRLVREVLEQKTSLGEVGRIFGVNKGKLYEWVKRYRAGGLEGLAPAQVGAKAKRRLAAATAKREAVATLRREHPEYGTRRMAAPPEAGNFMMYTVNLSENPIMNALGDFNDRMKY